MKQRVARFRRYVLPVTRMLASVVEQGSIAANIRLVETHFGAYFHDHTLRIPTFIASVYGMNFHGDRSFGPVRVLQEQELDLKAPTR